VQVHRLAENIFEMEVWQPIKDSPSKLHRLDHAILRRGRMYTLGFGSLIDNKEVYRAVCRKLCEELGVCNTSLGVGLQVKSRSGPDQLLMRLLCIAEERHQQDRIKKNRKAS
jgi:hypothetical protein